MSHPPLGEPTSRSGARGRRMITVLMVVAVGALLAVPATAGAHVSKANAKEYKQKLIHYRNKMRAFQRDFDNAKRAVGTAAVAISGSMGYPDLLAQAKEAALEARRMYQDIWKKDRSGINKDIDRFRIEALEWFQPKTASDDRKDFVAALKLVQEGGFEELFAADRDLTGALLALGVSADFQTADNRIAQGIDGAIMAQTKFDVGLTRLKKLQ